MAGENPAMARHLWKELQRQAADFEGLLGHLAGTDGKWCQPIGMQKDENTK